MVYICNPSTPVFCSKTGAEAEEFSSKIAWDMQYDNKNKKDSFQASGDS